MTEYVDGYPHGIRPSPRAEFRDSLDSAMAIAKRTGKPTTLEFDGLTISVQRTKAQEASSEIAR